MHHKCDDVQRNLSHLEFVESTALVVFVPQHIILATRPLLVVITLTLELLRQVVQSLQPASRSQLTNCILTTARNQNCDLSEDCVVSKAQIYGSFHHRLRRSTSPVLTATHHSYGSLA